MTADVTLGEALCRVHDIVALGSPSVKITLAGYRIGGFRARDNPDRIILTVEVATDRSSEPVPQ